MVDRDHTQSDAEGTEQPYRDAMTSTLYDELRMIAARQLRSERRGHTLQPTALVNEAYLKLAKQETNWNDAGHFRAVASNVMRRILVDHARGKAADKRGGQFQRVCLTLSPVLDRNDPVELAVVHDLLESLEQLNPRHAKVVEYRIFGGLTLPEIAEALHVSLATVKKDWRFAKAWLLAELSDVVNDQT